MDMLRVLVGCERATRVEPSERVCRLAVMFGLGVEESKTVTVVPDREVALRRGEVVFVTGASGSGKSTLVGQLCEGVRASDPGQGGSADSAAMTGLGRVVLVEFEGLGEVVDGPLVEILGDDLAGACRLLSLAGLGDAFVMLRRPSQLSDGQRYRLKLAVAMAVVEGVWVDWADEAAARQVAARNGGGGDVLYVVVADEFGATLDRVTAKGVARSVRKWVNRTGACFVAATTHDDLLEAIEPDVVVWQRLGGGMAVWERDCVEDNAAKG